MAEDKLISNGGGFGNGLYDAGSFSSNPLKDPSTLGTAIRISAGGAAYVLGKRQFTTFSDPNKSGTGRAATGQERTIGMYNPQGKGFENNDNWDESDNREPYVDSKGNLPTSKWFAGVVVIDSLTMTSPSYKTTDDEGNEVEIASAEIEIQNIMCNVSQKKNIVRTRIAGRDGRVNQYINMDDYEVSFNGLIIGYDGLGGYVAGERPEEAIRQFVQFMERPTQVSISSDFLNIIGIERAIITDFQLMQKVGKLDNQDFSFKIIQDRPFEIFIEERQ